MIVRPMEFGMIQQQNTVSQVRHNEDVRPMVEQQTTAVQLQKDIHTRAEQVNHKEDPNNRQKKFDAKDKSDNEYQSGHKERKNQVCGGETVPLSMFKRGIYILKTWNI